MKKHFVNFCSPGTFVSEVSSLEVESWDVKKAQEMAKTIKERHGATPYGFYFTTKSRTTKELDSKQTDKSNMYYLGGEVLTLEDVKARNDSKDKILISNMKNNGYSKIIVNRNSWEFTAPLSESDVIL